jgi:hypothetical protein
MLKSGAQYSYSVETGGLFSAGKLSNCRNIRICVSYLLSGSIILNLSTAAVPDPVTNQ